MMDIYMEDKYKIVKLLLKYILLIGVFYVLAKVPVPYTDLKPFTVVMYYALLWSNYNVLGVSVSFSVGYALGVFEILPLYVLVSTLTIGISTYYIHKKLGKGYNILAISIYMCLSLVPLLFIGNINLYFIRE